MVSGGAIAGIPRLEVALENTGQTFTHGAGNASCTVAGKRHTFSLIAATVLPRDQAVIPINVRGLPEGTAIPCRVRLGYGNGLTAIWAGMVTLPASPHVRIIHTGPGAYSVVPQGGIPGWAIALIIIGALVLVAAAALLLRLRKREPAVSAKPPLPR